MAWYTDSAFRQLVKWLYKDIYLVTELVSADWLKYASKNTENLIKHTINEKPLYVQLFGKHPNFFVEAAKICEYYWAAWIDINMWCPAKKVIHSGHWSSLIKTPELAFEIVSKVSQATKLPVSVKTRLWWDSNINLVDFCKWLEQSWATKLVIHWRTAKQMYTWEANWEPIYEVKRNVWIPVIWNWDIKVPEDALSKLKNLDWVFVGRASIWDPWIFKRIAQAFNWELVDAPPDWPEKKRIAFKHMELSVQMKWEALWMREMRKHLALYVKWLPQAKIYRDKLVRVETIREAEEILNSIPYA